MKFVFIGYDYTLDIALRLIENGHELIGIHTFTCDNVFAFNKQIIDFANYNNIPITEEKITTGDIDNAIARGAKLFLSAGYPHKIPDITEDRAYAINMHPTLLPRARGMMPLPHIILNEPKAAGFTLHKITSSFDCGDIIYQEPVPIDHNTDVETLSAQIAIRANKSIPEIIKNIEKHWSEAAPQNEEQSSTASLPDEQYRTINWNSATEELEKQSRAFGRFGMIAHITNNMGQTQKLGVFQFSSWQEDHNLDYGTLLRSSPREIIISIKNGYACLKDFQILA
ncbi:MAG: formyltransferase family protein [Alphaproteobacteria bacterium]